MFKFLVLSSSLTIYMLMSPQIFSLVQKSHLKLRTSLSQLPSQYLLQDQETGVSRMTRQQLFPRAAINTRLKQKIKEADNSVSRLVYQFEHTSKKLL